MDVFTEKKSFAISSLLDGSYQVCFYFLPFPSVSHARHVRDERRNGRKSGKRHAGCGDGVFEITRRCEGAGRELSARR